MPLLKRPAFCSQFLSIVSRIRWIPRWSLKRNLIAENVMEHSWEVAVIAHLLGRISVHLGITDVDANRLAVAGLYHDCAEAITGDLPNPVKYHSPEIRQAYQAIERQAEQQLIALLPQPLRAGMAGLINHTGLSEAEQVLLKAADRIAALRKARAELQEGNSEYRIACEDLQRALNTCSRPEVRYFIDTFIGDGSEVCQEALIRLSAQGG